MSPLVRRLAVPAAGLGAAAIFAALYLWWRDAYFAVLTFAGIGPYKIPFYDLEYVLAGADCWRRGVDVYLHNPCELGDRGWAYSPLLLRASFLPGVTWTNALGLLQAGVFFGSFTAFPPLRDRPATWIMLAALISPRVAFAVERANIDTLIFVAMVIVAMLSLGGPLRRSLGYGIVALAGLVKIYPFVALALSLRERPRLFFSVAAASAAILAAFLLAFWGELVRMAANVPWGDSSDLFGAVDLPAVSGQLLSVPYISAAVWTVLLGATAAQVVGLARWRGFRDGFAALPRFEAQLLVLGALLMAGCFFTGQNVGYRGIHLLLALPALSVLAAAGGATAGFARRTAWLIVFLMWEGILNWHGGIPEFLETFAPPLGPNILFVLWLIRELAWWRIAAVFLGVIVCFLLDSGLWAHLRLPAREVSRYSSPSNSRRRS